MAKKVVKKEKVSAAEELRGLKNEELVKKIADLKQELFQLRLQAAVGKLENTAQLRKVRKDIARCNTILSERASEN